MSRADAGRARGDGWGGMIDAAWLSGTRTKEDSRSMGLITATRDAHIIVIFIKHRSYIFAGERAIMYLAWKTFDEILVVFDCVDIYLRTEREREREREIAIVSIQHGLDPRSERRPIQFYDFSRNSQGEMGRSRASRRAHRNESNDIAPTSGDRCVINRAKGRKLSEDRR